MLLIFVLSLLSHVNGWECGTNFHRFESVHQREKGEDSHGRRLETNRDTNVKNPIRIKYSYTEDFDIGDNTEFFKTVVMATAEEFLKKTLRVHPLTTTIFPYLSLIHI